MKFLLSLFNILSFTVSLYRKYEARKLEKLKQKLQRYEASEKTIKEIDEIKTKLVNDPDFSKRVREKASRV